MTSASARSGFVKRPPVPTVPVPERRAWRPGWFWVQLPCLVLFPIPRPILVLVLIVLIPRLHLDPQQRLDLHPRLDPHPHQHCTCSHSPWVRRISDQCLGWPKGPFGSNTRASLKAQHAMTTSHPRPYSTILFDLDGTLLDSFELIIASFHHTRTVHFGDTLPDEYYKQGIGTTLFDQFSKMTDSPDEVAAMVETYKTHNLAHHDEFVRAYDGTTEVVRELAARDIRLGLVTSKMRPGAEMGLRFLGLGSIFESVVCGGEAERGKPHPEPVLKALGELGVDADSAAMVGDSVHDIESANAAGVASIACEWGPFDRALLEASVPTHFIKTPAELLQMV